MNIRFSSIITALFLVIVVIVPLSQARGKRVYKIATTEWAGWSAINVADAKGFWKDQGIEVEVLLYYGGPVLIDVLIAEKVDFSVNMVGDVVDMHLSGRDMTILAELDWSHGGDQLILKKGLDIEKQLGNPVGIYYNSPAIWFFMQHYLEKKGMNFDQFRLVEMGPDYLAEQFISGRFFMILHYSPYALAAAEKGNGDVVATSADFPGVIPECLYGLKEHLDKIPYEDKKKIIRGIVRGADWLGKPENRKEYYRILNDETFKGHPEYSEQELHVITGQVRIHNSEKLLENNSDGGNLSRHLVTLRNFLSDHGRLVRDFTVADIFDNKPLLEVLKER